MSDTRQAKAWQMLDDMGIPTHDDHGKPLGLKLRVNLLVTEFATVLSADAGLVPIVPTVEEVLTRVRFVSGSDHWTVAYCVNADSIWWEAREPRKPSIQASKPEVLIDRVVARVARRGARR